MSATHPLVTVAFPLYRSNRFLSVLIDNIAGFDYPNLEIIVSDRHCFDDALEQLRARFAGDSRFWFIAANDQIDWVAHYNELLRLATGTYFCWMPHDDSYPPDYISQLVQYLETHPDRLVAFGRLDGISHDGLQAIPDYCNQPVPSLDGPHQPLREALRLILFWTISIPFRGLFRRELLIRANLFIQPTTGNVAPEVYYMFGVALLGRFGYVPTCYCQKRYYQGSTHILWEFKARQRIEALQALHGYLKRSDMNPVKVAAGTSVLASWTALRLLAYAGGNSPGFRVIRSAVKGRLFGGLLQTK